MCIRDRAMIVKKGTVWNMTNEIPYTNGDFHLERYTDTHFIWIDIVAEHLKEYFEEVKNGI